MSGFEAQILLNFCLQDFESIWILSNSTRVVLFWLAWYFNSPQLRFSFIPFSLNFVLDCFLFISIYLYFISTVRGCYTVEICLRIILFILPFMPRFSRPFLVGCLFLEKNDVRFRTKLICPTSASFTEDLFSLNSQEGYSRKKMKKSL